MEISCDYFIINQIIFIRITTFRSNHLTLQLFKKIILYINIKRYIRICVV